MSAVDSLKFQMIGSKRRFQLALVLLIVIAALLQVCLLLTTATPHLSESHGDSLTDFFPHTNETDLQQHRVTSEVSKDNTKSPAAADFPSNISKANVDSQLQAAINERNTEFSRPHPHAGARYPDGRLGYVADPTALQRGIRDFVQAVRIHNQAMREIDEYWNVLRNYEFGARNSTETSSEILSAEYICGVGPGRGMEADGGYKLLTEKIKIRGVDDGNELQRGPRILCAIYTYPRMRDLLRTNAISWGAKCDGFLAFSTETIPKLGLVDLLHEGEESYINMWQKVRSIWAYIHGNYLDDYDFFHLGGDDLYLVIENLRHFLAGVVSKQPDRDAPIFLGEWVGDSTDKTADYMVTGRPGYTLNRVALSKLVAEGLPQCMPHAKVSHEDKTISNCFRTLGVRGGDTRDQETGEQQYHGVGPNILFLQRSATGGRASYFSRAMAYWEILEHPNQKLVSGNSSEPVLVGPKHELEAAATYSVSLHDLYLPSYVARIHALLYKRTCPKSSTLGRALRIHCIDDS